MAGGAIEDDTAREFVSVGENQQHALVKVLLPKPIPIFKFSPAKQQAALLHKIARVVGPLTVLFPKHKLCAKVLPISVQRRAFLLSLIATTSAIPCCHHMTVSLVARLAWGMCACL